MKKITLIIVLAFILSVGMLTSSQALSVKNTRLQKILFNMQQRRAAVLVKKQKISMSIAEKSVTKIKPIIINQVTSPPISPTPTPPTSLIPATPTTSPTQPSPSISPPQQIAIPVISPQSPPTPTVAPPPQPTPLPTPPQPQLRNGLYVWQPTDLLANPDTWITKLQTINIGGNSNQAGQKINEIYLSAYHGTYASLATQYSTAIAKLHAANIQVYLLVGNYDWAIPATWSWINTNYVPLAANFDGVMLDVEPWVNTADTATKTWWATVQAPQDFQTFLNNWKSAIGPTKKLTLSIANWHDTATPSQTNFLTKIYESNADFITIMDYSTSDYISRIAYETTLAKPINIAFDIDKTVTPDPSIVFYTLAELKNAITMTLTAYPSIRGFAINDQELLNLGN